MQDHPVALIIEPLLNGSTLMLNLDTISEIKIGGLKDLYINPVFLLIPSSIYSRTILSPLSRGIISSDNKIFEYFMNCYSKLLAKISPNFTYIKHPTTL